MSSSCPNHGVKITAIVFYDFPDGVPEDPICACTRVEVEVGGQDATIDHFDCSYFFYVATPKYLAQVLARSEEKFLVLRSLIIVERVDAEAVQAALLPILNRLDDFGLKNAVIVAQRKL